MEKQVKEVAVIGGSLGGLMHAIAIKRLGYNVHIYDQSPYEVRESQASGIACGPQVREFCRIYGIDIDSISMYRKDFQILDSKGKCIDKKPFRSHYSSWACVYHLLRSHFDGWTSDHCPLPIPPHTPGDGIAIYDGGKGVFDVQKSPTSAKQIVHFHDVKTGEDGSAEYDLVIAADGANSATRKAKYGGVTVEQDYAGYIAWRATVPEKDVSQAVKDLFKEDTSSLNQVTPDSYLVVYMMPSDDNNQAVGERIFNWMWYYRVEQNSEKWVDIMTDVDGHLHQGTVPSGKVRDEAWQRVVKYCESIPFCPPLMELVRATKNPFISVISNVDPPNPTGVFDNDTVFLVGEAFAHPRPHSAGSTNQCAVHALNLVKVLRGEMTSKEWEKRARWFNDQNNSYGMTIAGRMMLGIPSLIYWFFRALYLMVYGWFMGYPY